MSWSHYKKDNCYILSHLYHSQCHLVAWLCKWVMTTNRGGKGRVQIPDSEILRDDSWLEFFSNLNFKILVTDSRFPFPYISDSQFQDQIQDTQFQKGIIQDSKIIPLPPILIWVVVFFSGMWYIYHYLMWHLNETNKKQICLAFSPVPYKVLTNIWWSQFETYFIYRPYMV